MIKHEFTTNDYAALNRAIDIEIEKQAALNRLSNAKARSNMLIAVATAIVALAFTVLLCVLIIKVWHFQFGGWKLTQSQSQIPTSASVSADNEKVKEGLESLNNSIQTDPLITTRFTVFRDTVIETGDTVVTGLTYEPSDMNMPVEQYCYLESEGLGGEPLADVDANNQVISRTENPFMNVLIDQYCMFLLPPLRENR